MTLMMKLLVFKEKLKNIYSKQSVYILPGIKFIATLISVLIINHYLGYAGAINNPVVAILVSAVCALLPINVIVIVLSLLLVANIYYIAAEMAMVALILYLIMYIFYFRFSAKYGYILMIMPILFFFRIPYVMPLIVGVALAPSAIVSMIFGTIVFFIMKYAGGEAVTLVNGTADSGVDKASSFISNLLGNKEMIIILVAFVLAALLVYGIKRMSIDHSATIGIIVGGILELIIIICATYILEIDGISPIWIIGIMSILSIGIVYVLQFFVLAVDFTRTEYTQFEDDDYYYYVKAVPKIKVTASDVKVKHINVKKMK